MSLSDLFRQKRGLEGEKERLTREIERLAGISSTDALIHRRELEQRVKIIEELEREIDGKIVERRKYLEEIMPKLENEYLEALKVFKMRFKRLVEAYHQFMKSYEEANGALEKVISTWHPFYNSYYELKGQTPVQKHPSGLFLDGRTLSRLRDFGAWLQETLRRVEE